MGGVVAIWQARRSVEKEVESSIHLVLHLAQLGLSQSVLDDVSYNWLPNISILEETRHLTIRLKSFDGEIICLTAHDDEDNQHHLAPNWFIKAVSSKNVEKEYSIDNFQGKPAVLLIKANPLDEIDEAWQEVRAFFILTVMMALLMLLAVNIVFYRALKSFQLILGRLKAIESGQYQQRLPHFAIRECELTAKAVNNMTEALQMAQQKNEALISHSLEIQETERQHLSQELHDELGQSLTAIKVMAVAAQQPEADSLSINVSIVGICEELFTVVRSMVRNLHPIMLTELGLQATLEDLVLYWRSRHQGIALNLYFDENIGTINQKVSIHLFRMTQECLTNVLRHAQASQVTIQLQQVEKHSIQLSIEDNGKGCDVNRLNAGFGILGMRQRIKNIDGELFIQSEQGHGLMLTARIPV